MRNEAIARREDLARLPAVLSLSPTFGASRRRLRRRGVLVVEAVEPLNPATGGGRTFGGGKRYRVAIWPPAVFAGFHVIDVYVHEYGRIVEEHGGPSTQRFLNAVQQELGIRTTRDTHHGAAGSARRPETRPAGRDPFAVPGAL